MLSACTRYAWFLRHYGQLSALEDKKFRELYDFDKSHFKACDGACDACGYGPPVPLEQLKDIAPPQKALQAPVDVEALWTWLEALNVQLGNEPGLSVYSLEDGEVLLGRLPKPQFADVAGVSWEQFLKLLTSDMPDLPDGVTALDESTVNRLWVWTRDELLARTSLSDCAGCGGNASGQMCAYLKQCGRPSSGDDPACGDRIGKRYRREAFLLKYGVEWHQWCAGLLTFGLPVEPPPLRSSSESMLAWDWFKNTLKRALKVSDDFFVKYPPEANLFAPQGMIFGVLPAYMFDCIYGTGSWDQLSNLLHTSLI
jgi:hypothetical protein